MLVLFLASPGSQMVQDTACPRELAHECDQTLVASKQVYVLLDPFEGTVLIPETQVSGHIWSVGETEHAEPAGCCSVRNVHLLEEDVRNSPVIDRHENWRIVTRQVVGDNSQWLVIFRTYKSISTSLNRRPNMTDSSSP